MNNNKGGVIIRGWLNVGIVELAGIMAGVGIIGV